MSKKAKGGGLYWGIAAGFEFTWGLIIECSYSHNYWPVTVEQTGQPDMDLALSYGKIGISLGYRVKF